MTQSDKNLKSYIFIFLFTTILGIFIGLYVANYIFMVWQKIPLDFLKLNLIFKYISEYSEYPKVIKSAKVSLFFGFLCIVFINFMAAFAIFSKPKRELHGSAKFAQDSDIRKAELILTPTQQKKKRNKKPSQPSVLIGKYKDKFLEFFGNEFVFIAAPTRSGKGVGIVIPNLLHYTDSVVVLDLKYENWEITAGFRSKYQDCYLFAPKAADLKSHRWNPLDYIDRDITKRMADIQNIASLMYPTESVDGNTAYFNSMAQSLFTGLVLYMLETPDRPCTMAEVIKLLSPTVPLHEWIQKTIEDRKNSQNPLSIECVESLMIFAGNSSDNTRAGISTSVMSPLFIFTDPMVAAATSTSDFRLDEVRMKKMSIYVGIPPNELSRFSKLLNLFFSQLINLNTRVLPEHDHRLKYQCLLLIDEFTALGCVEIINKSVAYIAGYNMRLMLIFQNRGQAEQLYTKEGTRTLLSNMACQIIFAPREVEDAEDYSKLFGTETVKAKSISRNKGKGGGGSVSTSDHSRSLLMPQELLELDESLEIIKFKAFKPMKVKKIIFHEEPIFQSRLSNEVDAAGHQKGLPINPKCAPPKLDVMGMLEVMRGTKSILVDSLEKVSELKITGKKLIKDHKSYLDTLRDEMGLDIDFFNIPTEDIGL